ncbi:MAG: AbrB/MazE/SpoVT family DNA-binding domain-containing protein [Candidatus Hydrothermarchaeales archaeon]
MERCALCKGGLEEYKETSEGVVIRGWKCNKCGETFFPSTEMLRWEVLTGRRADLARKVREIGNSVAVTLPKKLVKEEGIHKSDYILFERTEKGTMIKVIRGE